MLHILGGLNMKGRSLRSVFCISKQLFRVLLLKILFFYPLHLNLTYLTPVFIYLNFLNGQHV